MLCVRSYLNDFKCIGILGNGRESSTERDFYSGLQSRTARSPNSQQSSPHRSLSGRSSFLHCITIKCAVQNTLLQVCMKLRVSLTCLPSTQQTPSRWSCAAMTTHRWLHRLRAERLWGRTAGGTTEETPWKTGAQSTLGREERGRAFTASWPVQTLPLQDPYGCPTGGSSVRCVGWSALDPMCWWCTSVATQVRKKQRRDRGLKLCLGVVLESLCSSVWC